ncbi:MAG: hypothetical protein NVSMB31_09850 [Vulcanimicrobiaceae bacterium]
MPECVWPDSKVRIAFENTDIEYAERCGFMYVIPDNKGSFVAVSSEREDLDGGAFLNIGTSRTDIPDDTAKTLANVIFILLGTLADVLMSSRVTVVDTKMPSKKQIRRGDSGPVSPNTYRIVLDRGHTMAEAVKDAESGQNLRPGFPRRRHQVQEFLRLRRGKVEYVRPHQRGGKDGPGPGYLLTMGLIRSHRDRLG